MGLKLLWMAQPSSGFYGKEFEKRERELLRRKCQMYMSVLFPCMYVVLHTNSMCMCPGIWKWDCGGWGETSKPAVGSSVLVGSKTGSAAERLSNFPGSWRHGSDILLARWDKKVGLAGFRSRVPAPPSTINSGGTCGFNFVYQVASSRFGICRGI